MTASNLQPAELPDTLILPNLDRVPPGAVRDYAVNLHIALERFSTHIARAFGILSESRLIVGSTTDRPAATDSHVLYVDTDTRQLLVDINDEWIIL